MNKSTEGPVYHLNLNREDIQGARIALIPGDPGRVPRIAKLVHSQAHEIAYNREFRTFICSFKNENILVTSTGIGGPSTSIVVEELAQLGIRSFIRVGTTGAIQENIEVGDVIISTASVRLDGTSVDYAPIEYPAVASHEITQALIEAVQSLGIRFHVGITASQATFYPGQERCDTYSGSVIPRIKGALEKWQSLKVLNYEMESATLFVTCSTLGLRAGCVTGVVSNLVKQTIIQKSGLELAEQRAIQVAVKTLDVLILPKFLS